MSSTGIKLWLKAPVIEEKFILYMKRGKFDSVGGRGQLLRAITNAFSVDHFIY